MRMVSIFILVRPRIEPPTTQTDGETGINFPTKFGFFAQKARFKEVFILVPGLWLIISAVLGTLYSIISTGTRRYRHRCFG